MTDVRLLVRRPQADEVGTPFVDFLFDRVGRRRGARLMSYIQAWGIVADELGRTPTAEDYAARFQVPMATAYRDQALFRDGLGEETPARLLDILWDATRGARRRHILSAPIVFALHAPDDASPVLCWFVATVIDRLPAGAAAPVDRAVPPLAGSGRDRRTEIARAYRLAERAVFVWAAATLACTGDDGRAAGLASLERFIPFDAGAAAVAAATLREYIDGGVAPPAAATCGFAIEAASAAAELRVRPHVGDRDQLGALGRASAKTLREAFATAAVTDIVTSTAGTVAELLRHGRAGVAG